MLDPDGHVVSWNPGAERIKGYAANEIVGEHFSRFYTEEERIAGVPRSRLDTGCRNRPLHRRSLARAKRWQPFLGDGGDRSDPSGRQSSLASPRSRAT